MRPQLNSGTLGRQRAGAHHPMSKTSLFESVSKLDLDSTKAALKQQPSLLSVTDRQGRNLLHLACSASCADLKVSEAVSARLVNLLLDLGLDSDSTLGKNRPHSNPVWFAVARGRNATLVKLLVRRGAKPRGLFAAGWIEDTKMVTLLIELGAQIDEVVEDETPFLHCWKNRKFLSARLLVRKGADIDFQDSKGKTALHYGIEKEFEPALLKFLVASGASTKIGDHEGVTPLTRAARKRDKRFLDAID